MKAGILTIDDFDYRGKTVILRPDINSPVNHETNELADDNRIRKSLTTIREIADSGARLVMLAHQGDTEDYQNLISLEPHAKKIAELLGRPVFFADDICGPTAISRIKTLRDGEIMLLNNVRYLTEEVSTFLNFVKLTPEQLTQTWLVRNLAPLADYYVSEAFAAAHRYTPSLVGFIEALPSAGGRLLIEEFGALAQVKETPTHPCVYVLGGARIADAFSMMNVVLSEGAADYVLTSGLTGEVMHLAQGRKLGSQTEKLIDDKGLMPFVEKGRQLLQQFGNKILYPDDFAIDCGGRKEISIQDLPTEHMIVDVGSKTIERYIAVIHKAATIFINGPAGIYEKPASSLGTQKLWTAISEAPGYSVIGGGDSVAAAKRFNVKEKFSFVCTSGGGMVRFLSGLPLPVIDALRRAAKRQGKKSGS
jgi:phosphoglycerate kinase